MSWPGLVSANISAMAVLRKSEAAERDKNMAKDTPSIKSKAKPALRITGAEYFAQSSQSLEELLKALILRDIKIAS